MANEFIKSTKVVPAGINSLAKSIDINKNLGSIAQGSLLTIDPDGNFADGNIGDETIGGNGTMLVDLKARETGNIKLYNASGILQQTIPWIDIATQIGMVNKYFIWGLVPEFVITFGVVASITKGSCITEDGTTILNLSSTTLCDPTDFFTPLSALTTYHLFLYKHTNGSDVLGFSDVLNPVAGTGTGKLPNLDGTKYRRIASNKTDNTAPFLRRGVSTELSGGAFEMHHNEPIIDYSSSAISGTITSSNPTLPYGLRSLYYMGCNGNDANSIIKITDLLGMFFDQQVGGSITTDDGIRIEPFTNNAGQFSYTKEVDGLVLTFKNFGFVDYRNQY